MTFSLEGQPSETYGDGKEKTIFPLSNENKFNYHNEGKEEKPLSGFIFDSSKEETLKPADKFEDEEEEEEITFRSFEQKENLQNIDDQEKARKEALAASINDSYGKAYPDEVSDQQRTEEGLKHDFVEAEVGLDEPSGDEQPSEPTLEPQTLELNVGEGEEEVPAESPEKKDDTLSQEVSDELPTEKPEDNFKDPGERELDQEVPVKISSFGEPSTPQLPDASTQEPKLIDEGDTSESDEIVPIKINFKTEDGKSPLTPEDPKAPETPAQETSLADRLESELADQAAVNPALEEVITQNETASEDLSAQDKKPLQETDTSKEETEPDATDAVQVKKGEQADSKDGIVTENKEDTLNPTEPEGNLTSSFEAPETPSGATELDEEKIELGDVGEELANAWEQYKTATDEPSQEKVINEIGYRIGEYQQEYKNVFDVYGAIDQIANSLFNRTIIVEENGKVKETKGVSVNLTPINKVNDSQNITPEELEFKNKILSAFFGFEEIEETGGNKKADRTNLRNFFVSLAECLRSQKMESTSSSSETVAEEEEEENISLAPNASRGEIGNLDEETASEEVINKIELRKDLSRAELGKIIIDLAKEEIEDNGSIPDPTVLGEIYDREFEAFLSSSSLFDLEVLIKANKKVLETAKSKDISSIVTLSQSLEDYLLAKRDEKEKRLREFTAKSLESRI